MLDPEIDRRCISCGASVRPQSVFCPQCGQNVTKPPDEHAPESDKGPLDHSANRDTVILSGSTVADFSETPPLPPVSDFSETQPLTAMRDLSETQPLTALHDHSETQPLSSFASVPQPPASIPPRPQPPIPARQVRDGNLKGRVNKLRQVSSVVIDQAAYDPSLRFILIAGVLFLLFVVLLIFSKVLG